MPSLSTEKNERAGATRVGELLATFVNDYSKNVIDSKTIAVILRDGRETGDIDPLTKNMEAIHKKAKKVTWLNPPADYTSYRPEVAGMKAAMLYADVFAPVHTAESLRRLSYKL